MLKNLLKLFSETFLKSKKSWIQSTTFIQDKGVISLSWESFTNTQRVEFTAPENGLFQCVIRTRTPNQIWIICDSHNAGAPRTIFDQSSSDNWLEFFYRMEKGSKYRIRITTAVSENDTLLFIPFN